MIESQYIKLYVYIIFL